MRHGPADVKLPGPGARAIYICFCGEIRDGDIVEAGKAMQEHEKAGWWDEFVEAAFEHRKVWILGREFQL
jgi:hypothetical protein